MNDDPYGTITPASSILPLPAAIALLVLFFVLGALFAMCESAVDSANESRVKKDAENGSRRAKKFLAYLDANESFASPLQFGMMLMGFFAIGVSVVGFSPLLDNALLSTGLAPLFAAALSIVLSTLLCAALFLTASDFVPKKFVAHKAARSMRSSYKLVGMIRALSGSMRPFMKLCDLISDGVMRLLGNDPKALGETVTEEEILHMVGEGEEKGVIEENELDMITNILDFNDTTVSEVMTHRTDICAVSEDSSITDVAAVAVEEGFSRLPVYREDIDTIVGICYVKDFLPYIDKPIPEFIHLRDMLRPAYFIPETKKCSQLFKELKERRLQIAVIVDEYGGTAGLVTLEDIVEAIVGNIQDEYDNEDEEISKINETTFTIDGITDLEEVEEQIGIKFPEDDYDTLGGFIISRLGFLPQDGEMNTVEYENVRFTVLNVEERRIGRVKVEILPKDDAKDSSETDEKKSFFERNRKEDTE